MLKEGDFSKEVTLGENVTFACSAEGNPPPKIQWIYPLAVNVKTTLGGRHNTISITEATSTNAGVYICVATNEVGNATRSVTLMMKGIIEYVLYIYGNVNSKVVTDVDVAIGCRRFVEHS